MASESIEAEKSSWFDDGPPKISESTRKLLVTYSNVPPEQVEQHCIDVRDKAYAIHPYPCIGQWRFLNLFIGQHPLYENEILPRMRDQGQNYLDLGCCFAQDLRRLVADGVEDQRCWASDLRLDFVDIGFDLFRDRGRLKATFIEADILDASGSDKLTGVEGNFDIIGASSFFHLFNWDDQKQAAHRVVRLLRRDVGGLIVGRQIADKNPGEYERMAGKGTMYRHDPGSWKRLWDEVSDELHGSVRFETQANLIPVENAPNLSEPVKGKEEVRQMMVFTIRTR